MIKHAKDKYLIVLPLIVFMFCALQLSRNLLESDAILDMSERISGVHFTYTQIGREAYRLHVDNNENFDQISQFQVQVRDQINQLNARMSALPNLTQQQSVLALKLEQSIQAIDDIKVYISTERNAQAYIYRTMEQLEIRGDSDIRALTFRLRQAMDRLSRLDDDGQNQTITKTIDELSRVSNNKFSADTVALLSKHTQAYIHANFGLREPLKSLTAPGGFLKDVDLNPEIDALWAKNSAYFYLYMTLISLDMVFLISLLFRLLRAYRRANERLANDNRELDCELSTRVVELEQMAVELEEKRDAAMAADKAKSEFLANMSHEIRTPLNGIVGMAQIMAKTNLDVKQQGFIKTILSSSDSLLGIINDILDFSKVEAGHIELESLPVDLLELIEDVVDQMTPISNKQRDQIIIDYDVNIPGTVDCDPVRIRQIITNFFSNAIKFTNEGMIAVHARLESNYKDMGDVIYLAIEDSGTGIAKDKQDHIFEAFTQENASTTRQYGGTGLGLSICSKLVELMGGDIGVDSDVGKGSTFYFRFPIVNPQDKSNSNVQRAKPFSHFCPLIVDNNDIRRRSVMMNLDAWGLNYEALNSLTALEELIGESQEEGAYDLMYTCVLISSDLTTAFAMEVDNQPALKHLPRISLAPVHLQDTTELEQDVDIAAYLSSPIKPSPFMDMLANIHSDVLEDMESDKQTLAADTPFDFSGRRALLVDDTEVNRLVAEMLLEDVGFEVLFAVNGQECVDALEITDFDVILMDCQMPIMDGYEASERIRQMDQPKCNSLIVAMTANALKGDREKCLSAGMNDYVSKPIDADALYATLANWLPNALDEKQN